MNLNVSHTYINDLEVILISPNGTQVKVIDNICGSHDNILCNLDDESNTNLPCPPTGNNTYRPSNLLSAFDGQNMNGDWTLRIIDSYSSDGGSLNGWGLEFTFECAEICNDGIDNDGDGNIDCADSDCNTGLNLSRWLGIPGSSISNMTNHANYPNSPNETAIITSFKGPINYADNYGTRVIGYIKPSITGNYTFNFTSDDDGQLYLSTDANPTNKSLIASQVGWSNINGHNSFPSQTSGTISLVAGQHYYVEFLQKEGGGGDHFHVYWKTPNNSTWQIIPGANLVPTGCYEICNDGIDNDGDGMIDCADTDSDCYPISLTPRYNINNQTWTNGNSITVCAGTDLKLGVQNGVQSSIKLTYPNNTVDNSPDGDSFFNINTNTATSGNYKITYTNSQGCSSEAVFTVNISNVSISNVTSTNPSNCPTLNNGSIVINATGSNLQYSIDNGANYYNTNTFSNLSAGSYQIKVKDSSSQCEESYSSNVTLTDPSCADPCTDSNGDGNIDCNDTGCMPVINNVAIVSPTNCPQANNGSITITATGLNLLYSINGTNYQSNNTFNGLSAGNYNIHVRNTISNCTAVYSSNPAVLTAPDCSEICNNNYDDDGDGLTDCLDPDCGAPVINNVSSTNNTDCNNANGSISISATGNNLVYSITGAAPFVANPNFVNLGAGSYTIIVKNNQTGCITNNGVIILTGPTCVEVCDNGIDDDGDGLVDCADPDCSQLNISNIAKTNPSNCPDKNNGSIVISATGSNLQYSINNGLSFQSSNSFTGLVAGTYNISIKNSVSGCTLNASSASVLSDPNCSPNYCGNVSYTDCEGNSGSGNFTSTHTYILKAGSISDRPFCIGDVSPNCTVVNKRTAYCLEYGVNEGSQNDRFVRSSYSDPNIRWGDYGTTVQRRALIACRIRWITCNYPFSLDAQSAVWKLTKPNLGTGPGGTAIYNAAVAAVPTVNGTQDLLEVYRKEPLTNSRQDIFVWDCQSPCNINPLVSGNNSICEGESTVISGSASGGTPSYSYQWLLGSTILGTTSSISVSPNSATTYTLKVTDSQGCTATTTYTVNVNPLPSATASATGSSCSMNNGAIQISFPNHPSKTNISFSIDNGSTYPVTVLDNTGSYTWSGLSTGSYQVWCRWGDGSCPVPLGTVNVIANGSPTASIIGDSNICSGSNTVLTVSATNGTQPYAYAWNHGLSNVSSHTVSPTATTTYQVTVTDVNSCSTVVSHQVEVTDKPAISLGTDTPCYETGSTISSTVTGGTAPYTYMTTGPNSFTANTPSVTAPEAGTYTMTVTDSKGCTASSSIVIHPALNTQLTASADTICLGASSTLSVTPTGLNYSWDTGQTTNSITFNPQASKWYKVTTTDANGCTAVDSARIVVNAAAITNLTTASHLDCDGNCTGSIDVTVSGNTNGNFNLQYTYNGTVYNKGPYVLTNAGQEEVFTINQLCAGQYSNIKIVGQETGCSSTWSSNVTITQTNADWEHVTHTSDVSNCNGACDGSFTIDANLGVTGNFNVSYVFNGNTVTLGPYNHAGDILIDNLCAGTYSNITITSMVSGCQDVWPTDIVIKEPKPTASIVTKEDDFCQLGAGSATIRVTSGATPYTIQWTSADGSHTGTETLTINGNKKFEGLIGGKNYCFNIKDANGCSP